MTTGVRRDPYLDFRFLVELGELIVGGFSEVQGLEAELETEEYEEGGVNNFAHVLPGRWTYPNLTLERGMTRSTELWDWMNEARHGAPERRSGRIVILNSRGLPVRGWEFIHGYPVRWEGPALNAEQGDVAIETLEIAHQGLQEFSP